MNTRGSSAGGAEEEGGRGYRNEGAQAAECPELQGGRFEKGMAAAQAAWPAAQQGRGHISRKKDALKGGARWGAQGVGGAEYPSPQYCLGRMHTQLASAARRAWPHHKTRQAPLLAGTAVDKQPSPPCPSH